MRSDDEAEQYELEARRLQRNLRGALFIYFLSSLPTRTPSVDIALLADELVTSANHALIGYFDAKGIPDA